jgi:hypothetical protein
MRRRDVQSRISQLADQPVLVRGVLVAVQQADRDRLGAKPANCRDRTARGPRSERELDAAVGSYPLRNAHPARRRHQGLGSTRLERVELGARLPADLEHILEAARGEEHDPSASALEQRVRRDGGAVVEQRDRAAGQTPQAFRHGPRGVVRGRSELQDREAAADQRDEIGEGTAGVGPDDDPGRPQVAADLTSDLASDFDSVFDPGSLLVSLALLEVPESFAESLAPSLSFPAFLPARA